MQFLKMPGISAYLGIANEKRETRKLVQNNTFFVGSSKKIWGHAFQAHKTIIRIVSIFITTSKTTTAWISKPYIILGPSHCAKEVM